MNSRKSAIAVLIAVLLIGCLLGVSGTWLWGKRGPEPAILPDRHGGHEYSDRFFDRLEITPGQEAELKRILEESRRRINACRAEMQGRMDSIRSETNEKISAILDDRQKSTFRSLIQNGEMDGRGGRRGPGRR